MNGGTLRATELVVAFFFFFFGLEAKRKERRKGKEGSEGVRMRGREKKKVQLRGDGQTKSPQPRSCLLFFFFVVFKLVCRESTTYITSCDHRAPKFLHRSVYLTGFRNVKLDRLSIVKRWYEKLYKMAKFVVIGLGI